MIGKFRVDAVGNAQITQYEAFLLSVAEEIREPVDKGEGGGNS